MQVCRKREKAGSLILGAKCLPTPSSLEAFFIKNGVWAQRYCVSCCLSEAERRLCSAGSAPGTPAELPQGQMDSLLSIISSQRERFRSRNQELEVVSHPLLLVPCLSLLVRPPPPPSSTGIQGRWFPPCRPAGEPLHAADPAGPAERAGQPEGGQHQTVREDQVPAELPRPSRSRPSLLARLNGARA